MLEWKDEYRIGIEAIDHEHRELIDLINRALTAMATDAPSPQREEAVREHLGEIHAQTSAHFALEEQEMVQSNYPGFADHKADHEALLDTLLDMMDEVPEEECGTLPQRLEERLALWFSNHFKTFDAEIHRFRTEAN
ncbi:MAG: hemerythrin-like metal-binding protein [Alphaproteobacteria bacterium]|nr:MAG: hemerythrin-like metal-binding protein [Alphaproteobacteria bacterium]